MATGIWQQGRRRAARMVRAGRWHSFGASLALLALLQSAVLLFHVPMQGSGISFGATVSFSPHQPGDAPSDHAAHHQQEDEQGDGAGSSGHQGPACRVCFALQHAGSIVLPAEFGVALPPRFETKNTIPIAGAPASGTAVSLPQPRAPPDMA